MIEQDQRLSRKPSGLLKKAIGLRSVYLDRMLVQEWPRRIATAAGLMQKSYKLCETQSEGSRGSLPRVPR